MRNKILFLLLVLTIVFSPVFCFAAIEAPGYEGGISNEYEYKEMFFLTGKPIELNGTVQVKPGRKREDGEEVKYTYRLENPAEEIRINRTVTVNNTKTEKGCQSIVVGELTKYTETLRLGRERLQLEDYTLHRSVVTDHQPAVDYYSGNWTVRKVYSINKNEGRIDAETIGEVVGYEQSWGDTETQKITVLINSERKKPDAEGINSVNEKWNGFVELITSTNRTKDLTYVSNEPTQISFEGGYLLREQSESIMHYSYDLPSFDEQGLVINSIRKKGKGVTSLTQVPTQKRLPIPQSKDLRGHWAEADIMRLYSLGVFDEREKYFGVRLPMTRSQFARAIALTLDLKSEEEQSSAEKLFGEQNSSSTNNGSKFGDIPSTHPDYSYVRIVEEKGIIAGVGGGMFAPDRPLTRAQAVTVVIRALGLQKIAPTPGYTTSYLDDRQIPAWARDEVYVATELGLVDGFNGYFYPEEVMTKAETAVFLNHLISYLQKDLRNDYRERIIYY